MVVTADIKRPGEATEKVSQQEEEDLKRAKELAKESLMLASVGLNPIAPGSTSNDLPSSETVESESSGDSESSYYEEVGSNSEEKPWDPEGFQLFQMQVPLSNWLVLRCVAREFFPTLPPYCESNIEEELKVVDCNQREWTMTLVNYTEEKAFLITKGWYEFTEWHNLYPTDVIILFMPQHERYYDINFKWLSDRDVIIPGYDRGDFLLESSCGWQTLETIGCPFQPQMWKLISLRLRWYGRLVVQSRS